MFSCITNFLQQMLDLNQKAITFPVMFKFNPLMNNPYLIIKDLLGPEW